MEQHLLDFGTEDIIGGMAVKYQDAEGQVDDGYDAGGLSRQGVAGLSLHATHFITFYGATHNFLRLYS